MEPYVTIEVPESDLHEVKDALDEMGILYRVPSEE